MKREIPKDKDAADAEQERKRHLFIQTLLAFHYEQNQLFCMIYVVLTVWNFLEITKELIKHLFHVFKAGEQVAIFKYYFKTVILNVPIQETLDELQTILLHMLAKAMKQ